MLEGGDRLEVDDDNDDDDVPRVTSLFPTSNQIAFACLSVTKKQLCCRPKALTCVHSSNAQ